MPGIKGTIAIVSDTHGLLRNEVLDRIHGCEMILHAGDVGNPAVLDKLKSFAPTVAIRGNVDTGQWAEALPKTEWIEVQQTVFYLLHDIHELDLDPLAAGIHVVISGHSHKPSSISKNGILYLNPGSAGPKRFKLPVTMAILNLTTKGPAAEIIQLV